MPVSNICPEWAISDNAPAIPNVTTTNYDTHSAPVRRSKLPDYLTGCSEPNQAQSPWWIV